MILNQKYKICRLLDRKIIYDQKVLFMLFVYIRVYASSIIIMAITEFEL